MIGPDYNAIAMNHPLMRHGRFIEVADEYIDACARFPDDLFLRRRAQALLGEITRHYWAHGLLPPEGTACFWRFVAKVPAFAGQANAPAALDRGPRAPVEAVMADAADTIRDTARRWAADIGRTGTAPRHLVLASLPHSGVSAIAPVLEGYLEAEGFLTIVGADALPGALAQAEAEGRRLFAWFHPFHETLEPLLKRPDIAVAYLHRDPRDIIVSALCLDQPDAPTLYSGIVGYRLDEMGIDSVPYFQALAEADPATLAVTFPEMKADVPGCARRMLGLLGLEIDEERLGRLCGAYSFQAMAGRKEGEGSAFKRLGPYVVRKGTSGQ